MQKKERSVFRNHVDRDKMPEGMVKLMVLAKHAKDTKYVLIDDTKRHGLMDFFGGKTCKKWIFEDK